MYETENKVFSRLHPEQEQQLVEPVGQIRDDDIAQALAMGSSHPLRRWGRWVGAVVLLAVVIGAVLSWKTLYPTHAIQYQTLDARRGTLITTVTATGNVEDRGSSS